LTALRVLNEFNYLALSEHRSPIVPCLNRSRPLSRSVALDLYLNPRSIIKFERYCGLPIFGFVRVGKRVLLILATVLMREMTDLAVVVQVLDCIHKTRFPGAVDAIYDHGFTFRLH